MVSTEIWDNACRKTSKIKKFAQMTAPILTRWWLVRKQACDLDKDWMEWKLVMEGILRMTVGTSKNSGVIKVITVVTLQIMKSSESRLDVKIIASIHDFWAFKYFGNLQQGDKVSGNLTGYQGI